MRSPDPERDRLREQLEADLAAFLEAGNAVQTIEPGVVILPPEGSKTNCHLFDVGRAPGASKPPDRDQPEA